MRGKLPLLSNYISCQGKNREVTAMQATEAASERFFSAGGQMEDDQRGKLDTDNITKFWTIKMNWQVIDHQLPQETSSRKNRPSFARQQHLTAQASTLHEQKLRSLDTEAFNACVRRCTHRLLISRPSVRLCLTNTSCRTLHQQRQPHQR